MYKFAVGFTLMVIVFGACKNDINTTGIGLLDPSDLVAVDTYVFAKNDIQSYTVTDPKIRTDKPKYHLLGTLNDPVFGKTTADFACQFRIVDNPVYKSTHPILSLELHFRCKYLYPNDLTNLVPQRFKVHELNTLFEPDITKYYSDIDLNGSSKPEVLADTTFIPKMELKYDSIKQSDGKKKWVLIDTLFQVVKLKLDRTLAKKLFDLDLEAVAQKGHKNDFFLSHFNGLYLQSVGEQNQGGAIIKVTNFWLALATYNGSTDTTKGKDKDTTFFYNTSNSARMSRFAHDYTNTKFFTNLDKLIPEQQDSLIYLQTTGGLGSKIFIPGLATWKDSKTELKDYKILINKAEITFEVDNLLSDSANYKAPPQLSLSLIDKDGNVFDKVNNYNFYSMPDYDLSATYYGGKYTYVKATNKKYYSFNIAKYMQEVMDGTKKDYGLYLSYIERNDNYRRLVLKGAKSAAGISLKVTYSKIK